MNSFYDNPRKAPWRGWAWNQIRKRMLCPVNESLVLYLCGPAPLDARKAFNKGFKKHNLLAISNDVCHVRAMRRHKLYAIHADLQTLLAAWPVDFRVDGVLADFCGNIHKGFLFDLMWFNPADRSPVVLNFQRRGRLFAKGSELNIVTDKLNEFFGLHRGMHAAALIYAFRHYAETGVMLVPNKQTLSRCLMKPSFTTAASSNSMSNVKFDSVCFSLLADDPQSQRAEATKNIVDCRRKIAAFRAVNRDLAVARA